MNYKLIQIDVLHFHKMKSMRHKACVLQGVNFLPFDSYYWWKLPPGGKHS